MKEIDLNTFIPIIYHIPLPLILELKLFSVDPRSSPVAHAAGRSPITHSHSTANRINHTLYDIHSYNKYTSLDCEGTIKEVEWSLHQRLQLTHKLGLLGLLDGTMEGVGWFPFHHMFNATMGRHCFTNLSTTNMCRILVAMTASLCLL